MATALQIAANRRNAKKSTGPTTTEGKKRASLSAVRHGMTAKTIVLPHECAIDYHEIRAALINDYAPATSQELMLVDQIAAGYWRTIRARRFETAIFDNQLQTKKSQHGQDTGPHPSDDMGCAVILQVTDPNELKNYFRYDSTISRDYYRAIAALEKMQAARRREEDRQERKARTKPQELAATAPVNSIGFVSYSAPKRNPDCQGGELPTPNTLPIRIQSSAAQQTDAVSPDIHPIYHLRSRCAERDS
jgi:hypothetical protein